MSLFSGIGHFLGNAWDDVFGGGNDQKKKKQQTSYQPPQKIGFASQNPQQGQNEPQQPDNSINLPQQKPVPAFGAPKVNSTSLVKAKQFTQDNTPAPAPPKPVDKNSLGYKLTHNPVTDIAGSVVKPFGEFGNALVHVPQAISREVQNKPINDIQKQVFGSTDSGTIARHILSDTGTIALTALAPGAEAGAKGFGEKLFPYASTGLQKVAERSLVNAGLGTGFGEIDAARNGAKPADILKAGAEGGVIGGAGGALFGTIPLLRKAFTGRGSAADNKAAEIVTDVTGGDAGEVAAGVRGVNPEPTPRGPTIRPPAVEPGVPAPTPHPISVPDGAAPIDGLEKAPQPAPPAPTTPEVTTPPVGAPEVNNEPAFLRRAPETGPTPVQREAAQAAETARGQTAALQAPEAGIDRPAFMHKQDIQAVVDQGQRELDDYLNSNPNLTPQQVQQAQADIKEQVVTGIQKLRDERVGISTEPAPGAPNPPVTPTPAPLPAAEAVAEGRPPVTPPTDAAGNPALISDATAARGAEAAGVSPNPASSLGLPERPAPEAPITQTVDVAPRTHDALVKQLGDMGESLKGQYGKRAVADLEDMKAQAQGAVANIPDDQLAHTFTTVGPEDMINSPEGFALARAALGRISQNADDPQSAQIVTNILNAMDAYSSKTGLGLRVVQEEFDNMPLPMKVRYIVKKIDAANAETKNYSALADDPARAAIVEQTITNYLKNGELINERVAAAQGQLQNVADAALAGQKSDVNTKAIIAGLKTDRRALEANNGELVKYYTSLVPGRSRGQKVFNDFPRTMMLGSFTGRVNDILTTAGNIGNLGVQNVTQGLLAKAVNLVKPGTVVDTLRGVPAFARGTVEGVRRGGAEFGGTQYAGDLQKALDRNVSERTGLQKATNPVARTVQAATEFATKASSGVTDQRLYQLAVQEGQSSGLKGDMLRQYAEARAAVPSRQMLEAADQLHAQVNNLNDNPVTHVLNRVAASIESQPGGAGVVGGVIKNQIIPFTSWLGGNIYNSITDKNVIASFVKVLASTARGDLNGVVENLAKTANNAAYTYALGYLMTQAGLITNENPQGYNDAGAYLHIGDRYIPVAFTGFFAPSIILGNAAYNGIHNSEGSPADKIATVASQTLTNLAKSININSALGAENNVSRAIDPIFQPGSNYTAGDAGAQAAGGVAGQFIPAVTGDINAGLNNGLPGMTGLDKLNPTHEAADTRVTKVNPKTGNDVKDPVRSALASLKNRIPLLSQSLPRKAGVAADDLFDRVTKGDRSTKTSDQAAKDKQNAQDQAAFDKQNDIPDPAGKYPKGTSFEDAVNARIQRGEYDKAISAYEQKLKAQQGDKNVPDSKNQSLKDQIAQLKVAKDRKLSFDDMKLYSGTSLTEWRNMGDPDKDEYDPDTYQRLWSIDRALADASVAGGFKTVPGSSAQLSNKGKYSAKETKSGSGGGRGGVSKAISSNTIGSTPDLGNVSFGDLAPRKINADIPTVEKMKPGQLIKKRSISVSKGVR